MVRTHPGRRLGIAAAACVCLVIGACGGSSTSTGKGGAAGDSGGDACVPGRQIECACADGSRGAQACNNTGSTYLPCDCMAGGGAPDSDAGSGGEIITGGSGASGNGGVGAGADAGATTASGGEGGMASPTASGGEGGAISTPLPCGNGVLDDGEICDDGNLYVGDGCSPECQLEDPFFSCSGTPSVCHRSCELLSPSCGPNGDQDCCASSIIPGLEEPTFYRSYDGVTDGYTSKQYPARMSSFRMDLYEISLGRFQKFHARYNQFKPSDGSGKNPNDPFDKGWDPAWNAFLPTDQASLRDSVDCANIEQTFTTGITTLPINCLTWYVAQAFCIWDGGRLPTEAEWNYAAAGGTEQRVYPWGSAAPGPNANLAAYDCYYWYTGPGTCLNFDGMAPVGQIAAGAGKWGQSDLGGNVAEWVLDWYKSPLSSGCSDCSGPATGTERVIRGGNFKDDATHLLASARASQAPGVATSKVGARCVRNVPSP